MTSTPPDFVNARPKMAFMRTGGDVISLCLFTLNRFPGIILKNN